MFLIAGHPLAAEIWGPLIGPVVAIISFVCSAQAKLPDQGVSWDYTSWLNIIFLILAAALIVRFVRTGGVAMLRMMGGSPDSHDHTDTHVSHTH